MSLTIKPHDALAYVTPREVVHNWDGVLAAGLLFETLWACTGRYPVARFWGHFTPQQQADLNRLASTNT
jgi:hypothetical protein